MSSQQDNPHQPARTPERHPGRRRPGDVGARAAGSRPARRRAPQPSPLFGDEPRPAGGGPPRRILLTGAGGFLGREVLRRLLAAGNEVVALSRSPRRAEVAPGVIQLAADVASQAWHPWADRCAAAIHLAGIVREAPRRGDLFDRTHRAGTESVVIACRQNGIKRLVHVSALGADRGAATAFLRSKWHAEEIVRRSGLAWTVLRPSLIFGPGDAFSAAVAGALRRLPVFPVFGSGAYVLQPVAVAEVAEAVVAAVDIGACAGEVVEIGGPEVITYVEAVRRCAAALGLRRSFVHVPVGLARVVVAALQWLPRPPITRDQLTLLLAGSRCDTRAASLLLDPPKQRYEGPTWLRQ
jgi:NADH dehydrogenase